MPCGDCIHYDEDSGNDGFGLCCRYPPQLVQSDPDVIGWSSPTVDDGSHCGEYVSRTDGWVFAVVTGNVESIADSIQEHLDDGWELCGSMLNLTSDESPRFHFAQPMRCRV